MILKFRDCVLMFEAPITRNVPVKVRVPFPQNQLIYTLVFVMYR